MKNSPDIDKWLKLRMADGVGPITFAKLLKHFDSIDTTLGASAKQLMQVDGIGSKTAERIVSTKDTFDTKAELALAQKLGVWIIHLDDARYPAALKHIYDPPPVLYIKGTLTRADSLAVAIVGSRRSTAYGSEQASRFAHMLASAGFAIVSGMARGIDTAAHHGTLTAKGRTIAVQGCGLANIFPPENKKLFALIPESGCCISELPLEYEPLAENFPPRNRIIAGLSMGVIVIEASTRSGALITAQVALEQNKEVMAVPGKIDSPASFGTNNLIKNGAKLVTHVDDVAEALGYIGQGLTQHVTTAAQNAENQIDTPPRDIARLNLTSAESRIYECLTADPMHVEELISETQLDPGKVNAALISLRLKGLIKQLPGNLFKKSYK